MQNATTFGVWLKQRRRARDLTRDALAEVVGCSAATIEKIETDLRRPSHQLAERLAAVLDIPAEAQAAVVQHARGIIAAPPTLSDDPQPVSVLPTPLTALIGRAAEVDQLAEQLQHTNLRLLTLIGPPGVGKTRLALAVAARLEHSLPDGARFIALAGVQDAAQVLDTIVQVLNLSEQPGSAPLDHLIAALHTQRLLLLLDNFEQVLAAAPQISTLLAGCPLLQVLVTSRERLHVRGERVVGVPPLALPPRDADLNIIARAPAVALFVDTAQAAAHAFELTATNMHQVATICARLDGLPLAIEIVAAQSHLYDPAALLRWLDERMLLHQIGPRDLPERHRTLYAALDWSYALLGPVEQRLFRRLGVCANGWTLDVARALADADDTHTTVQALVQKNLVQRQPIATDEATYAMLETVRDYACVQLAASGEEATIRQHHAAYYLALLERARPHLRNEAQAHWIEQLAQAHDNIGVALAWLLEQHAYEQAGQLVIMLQRFWWMRGTLRLGRVWVARVLAQRSALSATAHADLLTADALLASAQGQRAEAVATLERALVLARISEDAESLNTIVQNLGANLIYLGQYEQAQEYFEDVLQRDRETGELGDIAVSLGSLGDLLYATGAYDRARPLYGESLNIYRTLGDGYSIALTLSNLGEIARHVGDYALAYQYLDEALATARAHMFQRILPYVLNNYGALRLAQRQMEHARRCFAEALELHQAVGDQQELANSLVHVAAYALAAGQLDDAVRLLAAAAALRQEQQISLAASEQESFAGLLERSRAVLSTATFEADWAAGTRSSAAEATQLAQRLVQQPARAGV